MFTFLVGAGIGNLLLLILSIVIRFLLFVADISKLFIYIHFFVQDCRVVIWTKNEVGGGSWTSKVKKLCL